MGDGIGIACTNCDYSKNFMLGKGMRHSCVEMFMDSIHPVYRQRLEHICREYPDHREELEEQMFRCPRCERPFQRLYFRIEYGDGQVFERPMKCSRCKCGLEQIEDMEAALPSLRCPGCKQRSLIANSYMLWD